MPVIASRGGVIMHLAGWVSPTAAIVTADASRTALADAFAQGREVKLGIRGLSADLADDPDRAPDHEIFVSAGSCYYYTGQELFIGATEPLVRVRPGIPLRYVSKGWDFGWVMARTDGVVERWLVDRYTLEFRRSGSTHAVRWFVR